MLWNGMCAPCIVFVYYSSFGVSLCTFFLSPTIHTTRWLVLVRSFALGSFTITWIVSSLSSRWWWLLLYPYQTIPPKIFPIFSAYVRYKWNMNRHSRWIFCSGVKTVVFVGRWLLKAGAICPLSRLKRRFLFSLSRKSATTQFNFLLQLFRFRCNCRLWIWLIIIT